MHLNQHTHHNLHDAANWLTTLTTDNPVGLRMEGELLNLYIQTHGVGSHITVSATLTDTPSRLTSHLKFLQRTNTLDQR